MIRIEILGPFRVLDPDGEVVEIPRGKLTGLLAYLAAEPEGAERDSLEALFWPDASSRAARQQSLRQALYSLRKMLGSDPFVVGERVRLDGEESSSDYLELREALWKDEVDKGLALLRGIPFLDVPSGISVAFEHWMERRRDVLRQRLASAIESHARRALEDGDEDAVRRALRDGTRAGLAEDALRAAVYREHAAAPSWASASVGRQGVENLVYRARPGLPFLVGLVREDDEGWASEIAARSLRELPADGRPRMIRFAQGTDAASEVAALLQALLELPGGAAVRRDTIRLVDELQDAGGRRGVEDRRVDVEAALADALDAVLHEQALILVAAAPALRLLTTSLLAHAVELQGGEGLMILIAGEGEKELSSLPVRTLVQASRHVVLVRPTDGGPARSPALPLSPKAPPADPPTPFRHVALLTVVLLTVVAMGAAVMLSGPPRPMSAHDILFCSARSGIPQYYRWSASTGAVERFTADTAAYMMRDGEPVCRTGLMASGEGEIRLAVRTNPGYAWGTYPTEWSRADLSSVDTLLLRSPDPRQPLFVAGGHGILRRTSENGWEMATFDSEPPQPVPLKPQDLPMSWSEPWLVFGRSGEDGDQDLYRLNVRTSTVDQLTDSPLDESWGILRGDSLLFARGRLGDAEDGSLELFLRILRTGQETRLTENSWNDYEVRWSPDGHHICWQSEELGHYQSEIMVMDLRSRRSWNLSDREGRDHDCRFTPDGRSVLYRSLRTGDPDLILQPVEGGVAENITFFQGREELVGFVAGEGG